MNWFNKRTHFKENPIRTPEDIRYIADLLDTKFKLSNGWRFGWDGIIGLIPGIGNVVTDGFSLYIVVRAAMIGCPPSLLLRMGLNVLIDNLVDKIPVLGFIFDFVWKANAKNVELMEKYFASPMPVVRQSQWVVGLTVVFVFVLFISCLVLTFMLISWLFQMFYQNIPG